MTSSGRVVVVGSVNVDHLFTLPRFPDPGETVLADTYQRAFGGKGGNQATAARTAARINRAVDAVLGPVSR